MGKTEINWLKKIWEALTDLVSARGGSGGSGGSQVQADWNETDNTKPSFIKNKPQTTPGASESDNSNSGSSDVMHVYGTIGEVIEYAGYEDLSNEKQGFIPDEGSPTYEEALAWFSAGKTVCLHVINGDVREGINSLPAPGEVKQGSLDLMTELGIITSKYVISETTETGELVQTSLVFYLGSSHNYKEWVAPEPVAVDLSEYSNEEPGTEEQL